MHIFPQRYNAFRTFVCNNYDSSDGVAWSVGLCLLATTVNYAKTAEPIEMPFGALTWDGAKEPCIRRRYKYPMEWDNFAWDVMSGLPCTPLPTFLSPIS